MALAAAPELLLLDEPTAGMSPDETRHTARLLRTLAPATTIIIVEHDMSVVMSISDRISVLHRGEHIADRHRIGADPGGDRHQHEQGHDESRGHQPGGRTRPAARRAGGLGGGCRLLQYAHAAPPS